MFQIIRRVAIVFPVILLAAFLEFAVVLPLEAALVRARLPAPPTAIWFEGNDLNSWLLWALKGSMDWLVILPGILWFLSRLTPKKDRSTWLAAFSAVCLLVFGISVALQAILAPAHQYQASSEGVTFPNASNSRGSLKWSDVTSIELGCIYRTDPAWFSPGHHDPSLVLHFGDALALDLWEGARRANELTYQRGHVEDFIHHFGEVFVLLPPTALAHTVQHNENCRQDFKKLLPSLIDSAQQGNPPGGG